MVQFLKMQSRAQNCTQEHETRSTAASVCWRVLTCSLKTALLRICKNDIALNITKQMTIILREKKNITNPHYKQNISQKNTALQTWLRNVSEFWQKLWYLYQYINIWLQICHLLWYFVFQCNDIQTFLLIIASHKYCIIASHKPLKVKSLCSTRMLILYNLKKKFWYLNLAGAGPVWCSVLIAAQANGWARSRTCRALIGWRI